MAMLPGIYTIFYRKERRGLVQAASRKEAESQQVPVRLNRF